MSYPRPGRTPLLGMVTLPIVALFCCCLLAGCGGGGGGGSAAVTPIPATLTGTVDFAANTPASGYLVKLSSDSGTTNAQGVFSIAFDAAQIFGSQSLTIYDTSGALIDKETISVNSATGTQSVGPFIVGPPAPPAQVRSK